MMLASVVTVASLPLSAPPAESLLGLLAPTLVLLAVAAVLLALLRLWQGRRSGLYAVGTLAVVSRLPLSQTHALYLVRAGQRYLLLGGGPGGLTLLTEVPADEAVAAPAAAAAAGRWTRSLGAWLDAALAGRRSEDVSKNRAGGA